MNSQIDLSVVILSYNNLELLRKTLQAVLRSVTGYKFEVIVVDNDSPDHSADMVEQEFGREVKLVRNGNKGFSNGNNVGLKYAQGRYILFLNPDTEVDTNVFQECVALMDRRPDIGMLGCKLIKADGTPDHAAKRRFPNPWNSLLYFLHLSKFLPNGSAYDEGNFSSDAEGETDSLVGAFIMTRREVVDKAGGWDEDFFMYGEDIEYCYRVKQAGWKVYYYSKVVTIHYKGQSSKKVSNFSLYHFHKAMWIFYKKHYSGKYPFFLNGLVYAGIWARYWLLRLRNALIAEPYVSK